MDLAAGSTQLAKQGHAHLHSCTSDLEGFLADVTRVVLKQNVVDIAH